MLQIPLSECDPSMLNARMQAIPVILTVAAKLGIEQRSLGRLAAVHEGGRARSAGAGGRVREGEIGEKVSSPARNRQSGLLDRAARVPARTHVSATLRLVSRIFDDPRRAPRIFPQADRSRPIAVARDTRRIWVLMPRSGLGFISLIHINAGGGDGVKLATASTVSRAT